MLVGEPGLGKSTTIRRLAVEAARKRLEKAADAPIPILLSLRLWKDGQTIADFANTRWPLGTDLTTALANGEIILYLDGLNEIGSSRTEKAKALKNWLHSETAPKYVIVTCRERDYKGELTLDIPTIMIEEMDQDRIRVFVGRYFGDSAEPFLVKILPRPDRLIDFAEKHSLVRRDKQYLSALVGNPYLLAALMYICDRSPDSKLPENLGRLLQKLVTTLWERERIRQTLGWIPFNKMQERFSQLAFSMIDDDLPVSVSCDYAEEKLGDAALIHAGYSATFIRIENNEVRFCRQLIQS